MDPDGPQLQCENFGQGALKFPVSLQTLGRADGSNERDE
jgi:hypothetical protein